MEKPKDWSKVKPVAVGVVLRSGVAPEFYGCPAAFAQCLRASFEVQEAAARVRALCVDADAFGVATAKVRSTVHGAVDALGRIAYWLARGEKPEVAAGAASEVVHTAKLATESLSLLGSSAASATFGMEAMGVIVMGQSNGFGWHWARFKPKGVPRGRGRNKRFHGSRSS